MSRYGRHRRTTASLSLRVDPPPVHRTVPARLLGCGPPYSHISIIQLSFTAFVFEVSSAAPLRREVAVTQIGFTARYIHRRDREAFIYVAFKCLNVVCRIFETPLTHLRRGHDLARTRFILIIPRNSILKI